METSALATTTGLLRGAALATRGTRTLTSAIWATATSITPQLRSSERDFLIL